MSAVVNRFDDLIVQAMNESGELSVYGDVEEAADDQALRELVDKQRGGIPVKWRSST